MTESSTDSLGIEIARLLRAERERADLRQEQLARLAGADQSLVSRVEHAELSPRVSTVEGLSRA